MTGPAPWSVKGIDPRAREAAREAARRHGLTIGEWLNQAILANEAALATARRDGDSGGDQQPPARTPRAPARETRALTDALEQLAQRVDANDRRAALAMTGLDRTLASVAARVEQAEAAARTGGEGKVQDLLEELRDAQSMLLEQMQRIETEDLPQIQADEARHEARVHAMEAEMRSLSERAVEAEVATGEALRTLKTSIAVLDEKISEAGDTDQIRSAFDEKLDTMAREVVAMVADARADMASQIAEALGGLKPEEMNEALADMSRRVAASERRHASTIEAVSIEIKRLSESLDRRLRVVEERNDDGAVAAMREEIASVTRTLDERLSDMEGREASMFAQVGQEVGRVADTLEARVAASEARSAQAIEQVGEQVALMAERLSEKQDRFASEITQRIAQNEERHGARLSDALAAITARLSQIDTETTADPMGKAASSFAARIAALEERVTGAPPPPFHVESEAPPRPAVADPFAIAPLDEEPIIEDTFADDEPLAHTAFNTFDEEPLAETAFHSSFEPGPVEELPLPLEEEVIEDTPVSFDDSEFETPDLEEVEEAPHHHDTSVPLMDRQTIYVEEIQARFAHRDDENEPLPEFELPTPALRADDLEIEELRPTATDPFAEIVQDEDPFADGRAPDPFADIEAAPPSDDDDLFWSTEKPGPGHAQRQQHDELLDEDVPPLQAAADDPFGALSLDDEPPLSDERYIDDINLDAPLDTDAALDREMFDNTHDPSITSETKGDYLAAARRAAQAQAQTGSASKAWREKVTMRAALPLKDGEEYEDGVDAEQPATGLRGVNRIVLWGAAGAVVAALAGGAYLYTQKSQTGDHSGARPPQPGKTAAHNSADGDLPPGSIAEGAARASAERSIAIDGALTPNGEATSVDLPEEAPARAGPLESRLTPGAYGAALVQQASFNTASAEDYAQRGDPIAQYELALSRLADGETQSAVGLLKRSAGQGLAMAQYRLAKLYERGEGVSMDLGEARRWTERAAAGGNRKAMHDLGVYYARGEGAPFDEGLAFKWFRQAAENGVEDSQFNLGVLYSQGRGTAADQGEAMYWFSIAAAAGDPDARARAVMLEQQLGDDAEEIKARAAAFHAKPGLARANGEFGRRPWAPAPTLQAAASVTSRAY